MSDSQESPKEISYAQLQNQIKKNKTLLQSNFRLMEENEVYLNAFLKLKHQIIGLSQYQDESITVDEVDQLTSKIIHKVETLESLVPTQMEVRTEQKSKECQFQKWKDLYMKESEETYRLATLISNNDEKRTELDEKISRDRQQYQKLLEDYLLLYKKVYQPSFLIELNSKKVQKQGKDKSTEKKDKRSMSKGKSKNLKKNLEGKDSSKGNIDDQCKGVQALLKLLDDVNSEIQTYKIENNKLRQENCDKELLLNAWRNKQRQRLLYGQFL